MTHLATVPSYQLYGEASEQYLANFGHIETIAERSALHDWEISPHRHEHGVQVLLVTAGTVAVSLDGAELGLSAPAYVVVPAGAVHGFRFSPGACGQVLTLGQDFAVRANSSTDPLRQLLTHGSHGTLSTATTRHTEVLAGELLRLSSTWRAEAQLFYAFSEALLRSLPVAPEIEAIKDDHRISRFRHLVETHLHEQRPVAFYASSLAVTERTLTRLCSKHLHCTPHEAINRRCVIEAQRLLRYTNASVAQVANELGFSDPSYFSRFYLRMTGRRPRIDRRRKDPIH